jgi:hypothetical protein
MWSREQLAAAKRKILADIAKLRDHGDEVEEPIAKRMALTEGAGDPGEDF